MFSNFLKEIKNRSFLLLLTWLSVASVSYLYKETLIFLIVKPSLTIFQTSSLYFIFTNLTDLFLMYLNLTFFLATQISLFFIGYHLLLFLAPGLHNFEYKKLVIVFSLSFLFWILSVIILNSYILPISWQFFLSFQTPTNQSMISFHLEAKITEYINFYIRLYYICCLNFQLFVFLFIFLDYMKERLNLLRTLRKFTYFGFFLIATLLTPPDVFSQVILGLSLIAFFEILVVGVILKINLLKNDLMRQPIKTN